jgi:hypothetical protein
MVNFSPFLPDSGGLITAVVLGLSLSEAGFSAHRNPTPKKRTTKVIKERRIPLLAINLMVPSNFRHDTKYICALLKN